MRGLCVSGRHEASITVRDGAREAGDEYTAVIPGGRAALVCLWTTQRRHGRVGQHRGRQGIHGESGRAGQGGSGTRAYAALQRGGRVRVPDDGRAGRRAVPPPPRSGPAGRPAGPGWLGGRGAGRRWRQPGASSLSRARDKLGADPLHMLFDHVAGPIAAGGAPGVSCCGLRVISMDDGRSTTDVPDSAENAAFFGRPSTAGREGAFPQVRWVTAAESGTGGADAGAGPAAVLRAGDAGAGRPELPVLVPGPRRAGHRRTSCGGPRRASRSGR